jgi:biopolymer transport protein TolR
MNTGDKAQINVTPMIDVLLVLLIIFMTIGPHSHGLPALLPQPGGRDGERPVIASVGQHQHFRLNGADVGARELGSTLRQIFAARAEKVLFVEGAPDADFDDVAYLVDTARGIGIQRIALLPGH